MSLPSPRPVRGTMMVVALALGLATLSVGNAALGQPGLFGAAALVAAGVLWVYGAYNATERKLTRGRRAGLAGEHVAARETLSHVAGLRAEPLTIASAYAGLARIATERGELAEAARLADVGLRVARQSPFTTSRIPIEAELTDHAALARAALGEHEAAAALLSTAAALPSGPVVRTRVLLTIKGGDAGAALDLIDAERALLRNGLPAIDAELVSALEALALTKVGDAYRSGRRGSFRVDVDDATRNYITAVHAECATVLV